jgi:sarcinarray family protein
MRVGKRMRRRVLFSAMVLFAIPLIALAVSAGECCYGSIHAWFQGSNGQWENATAHPILKPGEVFHIKIRVTLSTMCQVFFLKLHEFGTPVYEVLAGQTRMEELIEYRGKIQVQHPYIYEWTMRVRPTTTWTYGSAPLEVFAQLNKNDSEECRIDFDVLVASIIPGVQTGSEAQQVSENHPSYANSRRSLPGFQGDLAFMAAVFFCMVISAKKRWYGKE